MQRSNINGQNSNYDSGSDEEVLESGLYCDFGPRPSARSTGDEQPAVAESAYSASSLGGIFNADASKLEQEIGVVGEALRRGSYNLFQFIRGGNRSGSPTLKADYVDTDLDDRSCFSEGFVSHQEKPANMETQTTASKPKRVGGKPRPRRGSHMMPEGYSTGARAPAPGATQPMETDQAPISMKPASYRMPRAVPPKSAGDGDPPTPPVENPTPPTTTRVKSIKPRRRRGSDAMPQSAGGQRLPTSAELMAQKATATNDHPTATSSTTEPSNNPIAATVKNTSSKPRRRRGSDAMPIGGGQKLPTSAELMAQKAMTTNNTTNVATSSPQTADSSPAPTTMKVKSNKPRRRRGSHMMPEGGAKAVASAPQDQTAVSPLNDDYRAPVAVSTHMAAGTTKSNRSKYVPPPSSSDDNDAKMEEVPVVIKTSKTRGPRRGSHMMPEGGMQKLSVTPQQNVTHQKAVPTPMEVSEGVEPTDYPDNSSGDYGPSPSKPAGHIRARRRGSVVKSMMGVEKDVDGDGEHVAQASLATQSISPEQIDQKMVTSANDDIDMMAVDNQYLPQRRASQGPEEADSVAHKKQMLTQKEDEENKSKNGAADTLAPGSVNSGKRIRRKKDIGRKAIRSMAGELDYVHKVIPKSNEAKELIYDAIKPNILFRACSVEELIDLVDAFEPKYVGKGSIVIQEGDEGDHFYVLERGGVDVYEKDLHKCSLYSGVAFGEIALLYGCPRSASILAKYDCKLWVIDRRAFRGITAQHKRRRLELKLEFLKKVKIHDKVLGEILKPSEIHSMALATKIEKFRRGSPIVRQGERGDAFYMIEEGSVDVFIEAKGKDPVVTLKKGQFFGEKALLSSDVRTATCIAATDVKCMLLMREDFVLMLGDLQDLLDRSYVARDEALRAEHDALMLKSTHPTTLRFDMNDFDIKRTLGVGAFGFVKLVRWKHAPSGNEDKFYALKCVSKQKIEQHKQQIKIKNEEDIMKEMVHPFIARCYSVMEDERGKYFLMEALCGGELCELLYHETQFSEGWSMFYSASVLTAFGHMHERKVAYRDLKPENLVLDEKGFVKIVDFGLAKKITSGQTYTFCGTPDYLAPEVILNEGYDWAVDYWGLGVLIYEMTAGVAPFYAESPMETYEKVLSGHVHIPAHFSRSCANLIKKLLHTSQSKRLGRTVGGATTVMSHPWFTGFDWDALVNQKMRTPYLPEVRDPDDNSNAMDESESEGFATAFF